MKFSLVCTCLLASVAFGAPTTLQTSRLAKRVLPGEEAGLAKVIKEDASAVSQTVPGLTSSNAVQDPPTPTAYPPTTTPTEPVGGIGGIDPNTGLPLIPVTEPSYFCQESGQEYSKGGQLKQGSCSSTPQGQIPSVWQMVSTLIIAPANDAVIGLGKPFDVVIINRNLATGYFDNPDTEFYTQPQSLDTGGIVQGHQHVTIQFLGDPYAAPEANETEFFKGLNDVADEQGLLSVIVPAGTLGKRGLHRICSMAGSFAHQPVIMPVAKRGAQDDCIRIRVE